MSTPEDAGGSVIGQSAEQPSTAQVVAEAGADLTLPLHEPPGALLREVAPTTR